MTSFSYHRSHWGVFLAREARDGKVEVRPFADDPNPSPIIRNFEDAVHHKIRVARPSVRRGWLENGPGPDGRRGDDDFIEVEWDVAIDLVARELTRVRDKFGSSAIYGGSYGWSSAGRFHHAQSQVHRFLNATGGYVRSVNSYSSGAASVIIPHIVGPFESISRRSVKWSDVVQYSELIVCFGGMAVKNGQVSPGGPSRHRARASMVAARQRGARYVLISPLRDDLPVELEASWLPIKPGTDTALMLGIAHTLVKSGRVDRNFLSRYCEGYDRFERYLLGGQDGEPEKNAQWASSITEISSKAIENLADDMAGHATLITVAQSLQRADHGEQPVWMGIVLAAMLGQLGSPGAGFSYGLGSMADIGEPALAVPLPTLPQGSNRVGDYIPVARIADMLLQPGSAYSYNGNDLKYPQIRLVYWAGGNPFHHHQDINRLRQAFRQPDTIVVNESVWTATARHADIVLPATLTLERADIGAAAYDSLMIAMRPICKSFGESKDDYEIFALLSEKMGIGRQFTDGRSVMDWLRFLYGNTQIAMVRLGLSPPDFDEFWTKGEMRLPTLLETGGILAEFRRDPNKNPLPTPSGKIEIYSRTIDGFKYSDCKGHPAWIEPTEDVSRGAPLHLIANQPATRLHSQLDFATYSRQSKHRDRETVRMSAMDAEQRGIVTGDVVRIFNDRGSCLAAARIDEDVRPGVLHLPTGAWYSPVNEGGKRTMCAHGNPNVLTRDAGTSRLAQGCAGQLCCVEIQKFADELPSVRAFDPPVINKG